MIQSADTSWSVEFIRKHLHKESPKKPRPDAYPIYVAWYGVYIVYIYIWYVLSIITAPRCSMYGKSTWIQELPVPKTNILPLQNDAWKCIILAYGDKERCRFPPLYLPIVHISWFLFSWVCHHLPGIICESCPGESKGETLLAQEGARRSAAEGETVSQCWTSGHIFCGNLSLP